VSETLKTSFSLATKVQPLLLVGVVDAGAGAVDVATGVAEASAATVSPVSALPPQPAKRTATEQKSKCTGFNLILLF
jgi:hypothetical protein